MSKISYSPWVNSFGFTSVTLSEAKSEETFVCYSSTEILFSGNDCNLSVLLGKFRLSLQLQKKSLDVKSVCLKYQLLLQRLLMFPALVLPAWYAQHYWYNFLNMILLSIFHICSFYLVVTFLIVLCSVRRARRLLWVHTRGLLSAFGNKKRRWDTQIKNALSIC